ncbi:hypothetical protein GMORB2_3143 [Geosmithia morbida]|uniref:Hemerythrin-like domain-containing protein n=1 Tax=Geosmithia morbida TaxID=1094350 RepID=A0A9P4YPT2_9HYPO|nr:uncharacterized protein GMORB2_3143 [Geosmithia morbida]KAF4120342.1 hypothetical protein GMORB2_3143 [Geosmithia morbida]
MASSEAPRVSASSKVDGAAATKDLPPLSDRDFRIYNRLAEKMDLLHNNFRRSWNLLWSACEANRRPRGMTLKQFINEGLRFAEHLTMHHDIEEQHVFPHLGLRMPEFRGDLQGQHAQIHRGLVGFETYLRDCTSGRKDFELSALHENMKSWSNILWTHLDDEVKVLGAENMRRYWSKEDMQRMPM